jgi:hypothetical protein
MELDDWARANVAAHRNARQSGNNLRQNPFMDFRRRESNRQHGAIATLKTL